MSKSFALSLCIHLILATFVYLVANPLRMIVSRDHDRIAVSVLLNAANDFRVAESRKRTDANPRSRPPKTKVDPSEHYHADPADKQAVTESREAHTPTPVPGAADGSPNGLDTESGRGHRGALDENSEYLRSVLELVAKVKRYPRLSQEREEQGLIVLAVAIRNDGTILDVRTEQTTPFDRLNRAAVETIRSIQKFPQPPALGAEVLTLHIPIRYKIESP